MLDVISQKLTATLHYPLIVPTVTLKRNRLLPHHQILTNIQPSPQKPTQTLLSSLKQREFTIRKHLIVNGPKMLLYLDSRLLKILRQPQNHILFVAQKYKPHLLAFMPPPHKTLVVHSALHILHTVPQPPKKQLQLRVKLNYLTVEPLHLHLHSVHPFPLLP